MTDSTTPNSLLKWMSANRDKVGIRLEGGASTKPVICNPDALFPVASVMKILVLGAYSEAVGRETLHPDTLVNLAELERWYVPDTDGNRHPLALHEWVTRGQLLRHNDSSYVPLDAIAHAMIRWSDNAACDYLLELVGQRAVMAFGRQMQMTKQERVVSVYGSLGAWLNVPLDKWLTMSPASRAKLAVDSERNMTATQIRKGVFGLGDKEAEYSSMFTRGTPDEWAGTMMTLSQMRAKPEVGSMMSRHLEWPTSIKMPMARRFDYVGMKTGTLAGLYGRAVYAKPKDGKPFAAALFLREVPDDLWSAIWNKIPVTDTLLALLLKMGTDSKFRQAAISALND